MWILESPIRTSQQVPALFLPISGLNISSNQKSHQMILMNIQNNIQDILMQNNNQSDKLSDDLKRPSTFRKKVKRKKVMSSHDRARYREKIWELTEYLNQAEEKSNQKYLESIKKSPTK